MEKELKEEKTNKENFNSENETNIEFSNKEKNDVSKEKTYNKANSNAYVSITTKDNPYNPFKEFDSWFLFDSQKGYNSINYLARISNVSDEMTTVEENIEIERAIDEIIEFDPLNIYKKVYNPDYTLIN